MVQEGVVTFLIHLLPRIGFVFIVNTDDEVDGTNDAGVALLASFQLYCRREWCITSIMFIVHVS